MALTQETFNQHLHSQAWYRPKLKIIVACSGGPDSVALLHLLNGEGSLVLHVAHIDHGLRGGESKRDAQFVKELSTELGLPFYHYDVDITSESQAQDQSIEEAGSLARRRILEDLAIKYDCDKIATAHHSDDSLETLLMNLFTGTGLKGLAGITPESERYVRPFLPFLKVQILEYLALSGILFRQDRSNESSLYLRNYIRNHFLSGFADRQVKGLRDKIVSVAKSAQRLHGAVERSVEHIDKYTFNSTSDVKISLGMTGLADYFSPVKKMLFDSVFNSISGHGQGLGRQHHAALEELLSVKAVASQRELPNQVRVHRDRHSLVFLRSRILEWDSFSIHDLPIQIPGGIALRLDRQEVRKQVRSPLHFWHTDLEDACFRRTTSGDQIEVNEHGRRLPVLQVLQEAHIAPHMKPYYPVLVVQGKIAWIPGVRTAHSYLIDIPATTEFKHCMSASLEKGILE